MGSKADDPRPEDARTGGGWPLIAGWAQASLGSGGSKLWQTLGHRSDTQLHEDKHRYRGNGAGVLAAMRTAALNLLRLAGFDSIRESLHAVMHDIGALLAMAMRQPRETTS